MHHGCPETMAKVVNGAANTPAIATMPGIERRLNSSGAMHLVKCWRAIVYGSLMVVRVTPPAKPCS